MPYLSTFQRMRMVYKLAQLRTEATLSAGMSGPAVTVKQKATIMCPTDVDSISELLLR